MNGVLKWVLTRLLVMFTVTAVSGQPAFAGGTAVASQPASMPASAPAEFKPGEWPMFRGDPGLSGVATCRLPEKPSVRWTIDVKEAVESTAAIVGGMVFFGADDKRLRAVDLRTGQVRWEFATKGQIRASPCVVGGVVYIGDNDGTFQAIDARTGTAKWATRTDGEINSSATYVAGRLLFGSYDGNVYCVAAANGQVIWKTETEGRVHGAPAVVVRGNDSVEGGKVLVAGCDEEFHVFNLSDGKVVASLSMGSLSGASPAVKGDFAYVGTFNNDVIAINWVAERIEWRYRPEDRESPFYASAAVAGDAVVVGGRDKVVHAIDAASGAGRWKFATGAKIDASPVVVGDRVLVASADGNLYALDVKTGVERWRFESGSSFLASPAVGEGVLVIGTEDGVVYCFGEK